MTSVGATGALEAGAVGGAAARDAASADKPARESTAHAAARRNNFIRGSVVF
jgi:hypothetical protein